MKTCSIFFLPFKNWLHAKGSGSVSSTAISVFPTSDLIYIWFTLRHAHTQISPGKENVQTNCNSFPHQKNKIKWAPDKNLEMEKGVLYTGRISDPELCC